MYHYEQLKSVEKGKVFYFTVESTGVEALRRASEKYDVQLPDAKFMVTYCGGMFDVYYQLEDYDGFEDAFGIPDSDIYEDEEDIMDYALILVMKNRDDNMYWGDILSRYLAGIGIEYEED